MVPANLLSDTRFPWLTRLEPKPPASGPESREFRQAILMTEECTETGNRSDETERMACEESPVQRWQRVPAGAYDAG